jgi:hypothetical protein
MTRYKIHFHLDIIPCDDAPTSTAVNEPDGSVSMVLSEMDATNIDACARAL